MANPAMHWSFVSYLTILSPMSYEKKMLFLFVMKYEIVEVKT